MFLVSIILALIGGALAGGGMLLADRVGFYLIVLVPVIAGAIIGFFAALPYFYRQPSTAVQPRIGGGLADVVMRDNRPGRMGLIIACILGTIVAGAVYWAGSYLLTINEVYQNDRADFIQAAQAESPQMTEQEAEAELDELLIQETGSSGFIGYLRFQQEDLSFIRFVEILAQEGITINRATSSSSGGINLQGGLAYGYWVVEILLMLGLSISTALRRARGEAPVPQPATA